MTLAYWLSFAGSLIACGLIVLTRPWHIRFSADPTLGVQKMHHTATPRIGGVAILLGLCAGYTAALGDAQSLLGTMLAASLPAFAFGLIEDFTKRVSVLMRLAATGGSAVIACALTGVLMQDTGVLPVDWALQWAPIALFFTAFSVAGLANAVNIVDGFNGLASGAVTIMSGSIGLIALGLQDLVLAEIAFVVSACAIGFLPLNWPWGKLFLGDGGAYLLGFCLAWLAVLMPMRSPAVNAWTTLLVCAYPVIEVGFSARRRKRRGRASTLPDRGHLHHLIGRRLVRRFISAQSPMARVNFTGPVCWLITALPCAWAIVFATDPPMLVIGFALSVFGYIALYARLTQFRWCLSALTLRPRADIGRGVSGANP